MLWYGTDKGLVKKDPTNGKEHRFIHNSDEVSSISNNRIAAIYEDREDELWIGTGKGLDRFNHSTNTFYHYRFNSSQTDSLLSEGVEAICEDSRGFMWLGLQNDLLCINPSTGNIIAHHRSVPADTNQLTNGQPLCIYEDKAGDLWVPTFGGTLNKLSPKTGKIRRFLNGVNIHSLLQDDDGILWVGTSIGLYKSDASLNSFTRFNGPNREFDGNMIVNGILQDDNKALWINASIGLCRLNANHTQVKIFSRQGDAIWYNGTGRYKAANGELFLGGSSGYFSFYPNQITENTKPPDIVINEFLIGDKPAPPGVKALLQQTSSQLRTIHLAYEQNTFSIFFAGIHYSNPQQNQHLFMLENLDKTWRKAGEEKIAYYYNVPSGHYIFHVKAANSDGIWVTKTINIIIGIPWWRSSLAYMIYVLTFATGMWMLVYYKSRRLKAENILLEKKMTQRTNELQKSIEEKFDLVKKIEQQQALLNERLRISRELHDDIGSTLGSISIYSEVVKKRTAKHESSNEVIAKIGTASRELIEKMSDIVWSLNSKNDSFEQVQNRMMTFAAMILTPQNIHYEFTASEKLKALQLTNEERKNIFLIFKETLHNIVKHADCKCVSIMLELVDNNLRMTIYDDGKGFEIAGSHEHDSSSAVYNLGGNGIGNMKARAIAIKAALKIDSQSNKGTMLQLTMY